jgi:16S rRNA (cytosine1402-N4)-methyltransferase
LEPVSRGSVVADESELEANPRSRSAKLRIAKKTGNRA